MIDMDRRELIDRCAPRCEQCGEPIIRTEVTWSYSDVEGEWWLPHGTFVCPRGHRTPVAYPGEEAA